MPKLWNNMNTEEKLEWLWREDQSSRQVIAGISTRLDEVAGVMALINEVVTTVDGSARAILYGGSVNARNATELLSDPNIHGLFIGRAAWEASSFINILKLCSVLDEAGAGQPTLEVP